jgi:dTDP-4-dehydrorhamnose reductase
MRILLLGKNGQVGSELQDTLEPLGDLVAWDIEELDLSQIWRIGEAVWKLKPDVIVNPAAYTAVDRAEEEPDLARAINTEAPRALAEVAQELGAALIHFSTDYVFDGNKEKPYTEEDVPNPINDYGRSKLDGEKAVKETGGSYLILRTSWVYSLRYDSFPTRVLRWARTQEVMRIVEDQVASPTWSRMLAEFTVKLLTEADLSVFDWIQERSGVYHLAGQGEASRFEWAKAVLNFDPRKDEQIVRELLPAKSDEFPNPARRPVYSALNCDRFMDVFKLNPPQWKDSLQKAMERSL